MLNHTEVAQPSYRYDQLQSLSIAGIQNWLAQKFQGKANKNRLKAIGLNICVVAGTALMMLGGIYLFLTQLAEHGW